MQKKQVIYSSAHKAAKLAKPPRPPRSAQAQKSASATSLLGRGLLLTIVTIFLFKVIQNVTPSQSPTPSTPPGSDSSQPSSAPPQEEDPHCLDTSQLQTIIGKHFELQREEYIKPVKILECSYIHTESVSGITPTISYSLKHTTTSEEWQKQYDLLSSQANFRRIEENPNIFATVNPGIELQQGTFYSKDAQTYLELNYTPVKEPMGDILSKGVKLSEIVLVTN